MCRYKLTHWDVLHQDSFWNRGKRTLLYLDIDNFLPSESEFCEVWLQSQFVVLWKNVRGKPFKRFLYRAHYSCRSTKMARRRRTKNQSGSQEKGRPKWKARNNFGSILFPAIEKQRWSRNFPSPVPFQIHAPWPERAWRNATSNATRTLLRDYHGTQQEYEFFLCQFDYYSQQNFTNQYNNVSDVQSANFLAKNINLSSPVIQWGEGWKLKLA